MRTITILLAAVVILAVLPATAKAGTPSVPSVTTSTTWVPQPSVSVSVSAPAAPAPQFIPFSTSAPYSNPVLCVGNVVTAWALDYCGSILPVASAWSPPIGSNPPAVVITAASGVCWTGVTAAVVIGIPLPPSPISGCGNASYAVTLHSGDILGASATVTDSGTVTLTVSLSRDRTGQ